MERGFADDDGAGFVRAVCVAQMRVRIDRGVAVRFRRFGFFRSHRMSLEWPQPVGRSSTSRRRASDIFDCDVPGLVFLSGPNFDLDMTAERGQKAH